MILFPAIDLYEGQAVRLYQGDYRQMTVYSPDPAALAKQFAETGATHIHLVDLEGARDGTTPNLELIRRIAARPACLWRWAAASGIWTLPAPIWKTG